MNERRSFSLDKRLQIMHKAETDGMVAAWRKYEHIQSLIYHWNHSFEQKVLDELQVQYYPFAPAVKTLEVEALHQSILKKEFEGKSYNKATLEANCQEPTKRLLDRMKR